MTTLLRGLRGPWGAPVLAGALILLAAALQGAIYAMVKALVDRGGARAFEKTFGEWPGD